MHVHVKYCFQVSLGSKLKKQLSLRSKSSKVYDTQSSYHFIQMRGPKLKGFAEMAVIRRDASYFEQPGTVTYSVDSPSDVSGSHSSMPTSGSNHDISDSHSEVFQEKSPQPVASGIDQNSNDQKDPPTDTLFVVGGVESQGGSSMGGKYSPRLRQAFLGQTSAAQSTPRAVEREPVSPATLSESASFTSRGSCSSQTGLLRSQSPSQEEGECEDTEQTASNLGHDQSTNSSKPSKPKSRGD